MLSTLSVGLVSMLALVDPLAAPAAPSTPSLSPAHYLLLNAPERRVRATDARLRSLLAEGLHRSRTFAATPHGPQPLRRHRLHRIGHDPAKGHDGAPDDDAARR